MLCCGQVLLADAFATQAVGPASSAEMTIRWSGGGYDNVWSKMPSHTQGYRWLGGE